MAWKKKTRRDDFTPEQKAAYHAAARLADPLSRCHADRFPNVKCQRMPNYTTDTEAYCKDHLPERLFHLRSPKPGGKNFDLLMEQLSKWVMHAATHHAADPETIKLIQETMKLQVTLNVPRPKEE